MIASSMSRTGYTAVLEGSMSALSRATCGQARHSKGRAKAPKGRLGGKGCGCAKQGAGQPILTQWSLKSTKMQPFALSIDSIYYRAKLRIKKTYWIERRPDEPTKRSKVTWAFNCSS
jgi:hypothetical protein